MPTISLPSDPDLGQLRKQAKDLNAASASGDADALGWRLSTIRTAGPSPPCGTGSRCPMPSWWWHGPTGLPAGPGSSTTSSRSGACRDPPSPSRRAIPPTDFLRLACLTYDTDGPDRWAEARALLDAHPDLPAASIHAAAAAADARAVAAHLAGDRHAARREGGTFGWPPLLYLTYSRLDRAADEAAVLGVARLLLDAGADPDSGFLWHGLATPFTALTGAFGGGEGGIVDQPHHPHARALARLLLDAGADPNDGQTLYNRMFEPDDSHLVLLFEHGLGQGDGGPWRARLGDALRVTDRAAAVPALVGRHPRPGRPGPAAHRARCRRPLAVHHPIVRHRAAQVGRTPLDLARLTGSTEVVDALVAAGVEAPELDRSTRWWRRCWPATPRPRHASDGRTTASSPESPRRARCSSWTPSRPVGVRRRGGPRSRLRRRRRGRRRARPIHGRDRPPRSRHERRARDRRDPPGRRRRPEPA